MLVKAYLVLKARFFFFSYFVVFFLMLIFSLFLFYVFYLYVGFYISRLRGVLGFFVSVILVFFFVVRGGFFEILVRFY